MTRFARMIALAVLAVPMWADSAPAGDPSPGALSGAEILQRYVEAMRAQASHPQDLSMEVDMDAKLPRLKKQGRLHALRFITRVGQIFYPQRNMNYEGDSTIKKEVIARYLQAEKEARTEDSGSLAVTPDNYKFKFKGGGDYAGTPAWVYQVTPKRKQLGLFKGELWIDQRTFLPLREWGELAKNPSVFLKNVYFVRDYVITDGISLPRRLISDIQTRLVGHAQLVIWYDKVKIGAPASAASGLTAVGAQTAQTTGGAPVESGAAGTQE